MSSTISSYFSALKKKYFDNLSDYDRGVLHGSINVYLASFAISTTTMRFHAYKRYRWVDSYGFSLVKTN